MRLSACPIARICWHWPRRRIARSPAGAPIGPLHGLPHAVKDLEAVAGLPWTMGSPILAHQVAAHDGIVGERLRRAGVVFIGKTNTPEFGLGSHTYNPVWGITRNAWNPARFRRAAAVAARRWRWRRGWCRSPMVVIMVGSLRNPAGWNSVFGFRTSIGRVPSEGHDDWIPSPGVAGPMARNVGDLALMLSVMAGYDARMPLSMESDASVLRQVDPAAMRGKRIAWSGDFGGKVPFDPGVLDTCRQALDRFAAMGAHVEDAVPDFSVDDAWRAFCRPAPVA